MNARRLFLLVLPMAVALVPATSRAADCGQDRAADGIFAHPYGEPTAPCQVDAAATGEKEHADVLADERGPRQFRTLGTSGLSAGATIAGIGAIMLLLSIFDDGKAHEVLYWGGVGVTSLGGAVFLAGGVLLGIDWATLPAPTPDRRGAQLMVAFRF